MPKGSKADKGAKEMKAKGLPDSEIYAILNKEGLMHGNKVTAKGAKKAKKVHTVMSHYGGRHG